MRVVIAVALAGLVVAACGSVVPSTVSTLPQIATSISTSIADRKLTIAVTPWPLDATVAFACVDKPGKEFTVDHPIPAAVAQCVPLDVTTAGDRLVASVGTDKLALLRPTRPLYVAVAGSRGSISTSTILTTAFPVVSPAPS